MQTVKDKLAIALLLCCFLTQAAFPVLGEPVHRTDFCSYERLQSTREEIEIALSGSKAMAATCVILVDEGTLALDMENTPSFAWNRETRELTVDWNGGFRLWYRPAAVEAPALTPEQRIAGKLLISYFDEQGACVAQDQVNVVRAFHYLLIEQEAPALQEAGEGAR